MRVGIVVFPGTNCDQDMAHVYGSLLSAEVVPIWHRELDLPPLDIVVLPGGFSYGDYLRTGALAKLSPIMGAIKKFAGAGGRVIGICNGFQILCEAGLLPGALLENKGRTFLSQFVHLRAEPSNSFLTASLAPGSRLCCPIAHFQGNYFADQKTLEELESRNQIILRYVDADGNRADSDLSVNVNGSLHSIAGICNEAGNVVGMMPHPERSVELLTGGVGGDSGLSLFRAGS